MRGQEGNRMEPKVSIIIPIHDSEPYLEQCLCSVRNQTLKEIEILCIDDCSADGSAETVRRMSGEDSRIVLIQNERNLGAGETRNRGIELAKGEYFFFLDSDDFLAAEALEKLYYYAHGKALQLCFCFHVNYFEKDGSVGKSPHTTEIFFKRYRDKVFSWNDVQRFFYQNIYCVPWNRLYRTEFVRKSSVRFPPLENSEDLFFGNALVTLAERMGLVDSEQPLVFYRRGREGQVSASVAKNPYCMLESAKLLYDFLKRGQKLDGMQKGYHSCILELLLFPIQAAEYSEVVVKHIVEEGFPEIGLADLTRADFAGVATYKKYSELLMGRSCYVDAYMAAVTEDNAKLNLAAQFLGWHEKEKKALWGMGYKGQALVCEMRKRDRGFDYYIDKNPEKVDGAAKEISICRYEEIAEPLDYIMLTNRKYFEAIYRQCKARTPSCKVIDMDTFFRCDMTIEECMA